MARLVQVLWRRIGQRVSANKIGNCYKKVLVERERKRKIKVGVPHVFVSTPNTVPFIILLL